MVVTDSRYLAEAACVQWPACSEASETTEAAGPYEAVPGHQTSAEAITPWPGASPIQPQITVAGGGDESEAEDDGKNIWEVPDSPAPRATRRRGRDNARRGETATRSHREARLDAGAGHTVRSLGSSIDGHVSDNDTDNANGEGDGDHHHVHGGDRSEPAEPNNTASSGLREDAPDNQPDAVMPYTSTVDEDAEGEPWCEPVAPIASMTMNDQSDDAMQPSHGDEPGSVDLTTMMAEDDWMQSAMVDFGQVTDFPGAHHWGDMLEFDLDNMGMGMNVDLDMEMMGQLDNGHLPVDMIHLPSADPHAVPQAPVEADTGAVADAVADAGNDAAKVTESTAATASDSHMPSAQSRSDVEMRARTPSDETHPSPRSTAAT
ncbi:hypothetical protein FBEOM_14632, partial [Fusarium beomiforme]